MLKSFDQKVSVQAWEDRFSQRGCSNAGRETTPNPLMLLMRNVVSPYSRPRAGESQETLMGMRVKDAGESEGRSVTGRIGVQTLPQRESVQTSCGSRITRELVKRINESR